MHGTGSGDGIIAAAVLLDGGLMNSKAAFAGIVVAGVVLVVVVVATSSSRPPFFRMRSAGRSLFRGRRGSGHRMMLWMRRWARTCQHGRQSPVGT